MNNASGIPDLAIHTILDLIRSTGPVTRSELSALSGLSRPTISKNCDHLLTIGLIEEENIILRGEAGKRTKLKLRGDFGTIVGIELGATSVEFGLCDISGKILAFHSYSIDLSRGPNYILDFVVTCIAELYAKTNFSMDRSLGVGIGLPARVDYKAGMAIHPAFMPGWNRYPVRELLASRLNRPVYVDNDANAMALGEFHYGAGQKVNNLIFIKAGTGIGAGIIIDGKIYRGETGFAGNIGHVYVDGRTDLCKCGRRGCLEAIAGGSAIARKAREAIDRNEANILAEVVLREGACTAREVSLAAEAGDRFSSNLIKETGIMIGEQVGRMAFLFDPGRVIIGGGLAGFGPAYLSYIREGVFKAMRPWTSANLEVCTSAFGEKCGVVGASLLVLQELFQGGSLVV